MLNYFKMKREEIKLKLFVYKNVNLLIAKSADIGALIEKLYASLNQANPEELNEKFAEALARMKR